MINPKEMIVLGASTNIKKSSYIATGLLQTKGYNVHALGKKKGSIDDIELNTTLEPVPQVDTVSIFESPFDQIKHYDYIIELNPRRIIFNPGTENPELELLAKSKNIEVVKACTIAMLCIGAL
jgi:predicted CoA-binding protein